MPPAVGEASGAASEGGEVAAGALVVANPPPPSTSPSPGRKSARCGKCDGCQRIALKADDCGQCSVCLTKPRFGGSGPASRACFLKFCTTINPGVGKRMPGGGWGNLKPGVIPPMVLKKSKSFDPKKKTPRSPGDDGDDAAAAAAAAGSDAGDNIETARWDAAAAIAGATAAADVASASNQLAKRGRGRPKKALTPDMLPPPPLPEPQAQAAGAGAPVNAGVIVPAGAAVPLPSRKRRGEAPMEPPVEFIARKSPRHAPKVSSIEAEAAMVEAGLTSGGGRV